VTATSDIPSLTFVDPDTVDPRWRIGLFGPPGAGKTVAATSAPGPILAVNADRPGAYRYSRAHHKGTQIMEVRFTGWPVMRDVYEFARANQADIGTVVMDPVNNVYEHLVRENTGPGGKPNWQKVGRTRVADLSEWIAAANADDEEPVPWDEDAAVEAVQEAFDATEDEDADPSVPS
jgi:hypothetical protein